MALTMHYRSSRFLKEWVVRYLKSIFLANAKGAIVLTDGTKGIEFSETPYVGRTLEWEPQHLPSVLIDKATTTMKTLTFSKDRVYEAQYGDADQYRYVGGDIGISLEFLVMARTIIERENLADISSIYLSHPAAKDYFGKHNIAVERPPTISGEGYKPAPNGLDFPIYTCNMSMSFVSQWVEKEDLDDPRLEDVISTVEAEIEL